MENLKENDVNSQVKNNAQSVIYSFLYSGHTITIKGMSDNFGQDMLSYIDGRLFRIYVGFSGKVSHIAESEAKEKIDLINSAEDERQFRG